MRLHRLAIRGLTVYREEQVIDFDSLPNGLIAIVGPNGAGKSSLIEAIAAALFRELPTRPGSLYRWFGGKDGRIELHFSMGEDSYRITLLVDAVSEKMEAYFRDRKGATSGKLGPFDRMVVETVGPKSLLYSSIFGTQDRSGTFLEASVAERKALFIRLLGIGHCQEIEKRAEAKANEHASRSFELRGERRSKQVTVVDPQQVANVQNAIVEQQVTIKSTTADVQLLQEQLRNVAEQMGGIAALNADKIRLQQELAKLDTQVQEANEKILRREEDIRIENAKLTQQQGECQAKLADLKQRVENNRKLLARAPEIHAAESRVEQITRLITSIQDELMEIAAHEGKFAQASADQQRAAGYLTMTTDAIEQYQRAVAELDEIPCHGKAPYDKCVKITRSMEAKQMLPGLYEERDRQEATVQQLTAIVESLRDGGRSRSVITDQLYDLRRERDRLVPTLALRDPLREANTKVESYLEQHELITQQLASLPQPIDPATDAMLLEFQKVNQGGVKDQATLRAELQAVDAKLTEAAMLTGERFRLGQSIQTAETRIQRCTAALNALHGQLAVLQEKAEEAERSAKEVEALDARIAAEGVEAGEWTVLAKAFGSQGIPALEIDAAGPAIGALVNDLLASCFSTRFVLKLATQREAADGKRLIEDFDALVLDQQVGKWQSIDALSGGEKVVVGEALAMAIAIYNKGEHAFLTCLRDETTGALDAENAIRYIAMLRKAQALGHFEKIVFVTHNAEAAELADAKIRCDNGRLQVEQ